MDRQRPTPHGLHKNRTTNGPVRIDDQAREKGALPARAKRDDSTLIIDSVNPPEYPKQHSRKRNPQLLCDPCAQRHVAF
jgi:hypothetical protein